MTKIFSLTHTRYNKTKCAYVHAQVHALFLIISALKTWRIKKAPPLHLQYLLTQEERERAKENCSNQPINSNYAHEKFVTYLFLLNMTKLTAEFHYPSTELHNYLLRLFQSVLRLSSKPLASWSKLVMRNKIDTMTNIDSSNELYKYKQ